MNANAPYCENATSVAAVTGANEIGPFVASTVEATYKLAVPPLFDTMKVFSPSGENDAATAFGICSVISGADVLAWL
jgi:hypothetical protein